MTRAMRSIFGVALAVILAVTMSITIGGIAPVHAAGKGSITITPPANTPSNADNTYKIYTVFDASGNGSSISYTLPSGKSLTGDMSTYFEVNNGNVTAKAAAKDERGSLTSGAVSAIATWLGIGSESAPNPDFRATSKGTAAATVDNVPNGYYYITTSTGTAVIVNSSNPDIKVNDKGSVPSVDKKITEAASGSITDEGKKAIAQVGSKVTYSSDITVAANTKNLKFQDTLGDGLSLDTDSISVKVGDTEVDAANYTKSTDDNTINISFADNYIAGLTASTHIIVSYQATVTSDALHTDPATNTASITYGDNNAKVTSTIPEVYNGTITVDKTFQGLTDGTALSNDDSAQFVLTNGDGAYYAINDNNVVSWVNSEEDATKVTIKKNGTGDKAFSGLRDGGYTLKETKVPAGYQKAADKNIITIKNGTYTTENLKQTASITNEQGSALPSTGGIGTTILYIIGAALIIGAVTALIRRRRAQG